MIGAAFLHCWQSLATELPRICCLGSRAQLAGCCNSVSVGQNSGSCWTEPVRLKSTVISSVGTGGWTQSWKLVVGSFSNHKGASLSLRNHWHSPQPASIVCSAFVLVIMSITDTLTISLLSFLFQLSHTFKKVHCSHSWFDVATLLFRNLIQLF